MPNTFTRHYLAAAIATALLPISAQATTTLDVSNLAPLELKARYEDDLRLIGSVTADTEALVVLTGIVEGSLVNDADISVDNHDPHGFSSNGTLYLENGSWVRGDVINNGSLFTRNINDVNVFIGGASVDGRFINRGHIELLDEKHSELSGVTVTRSFLEGGFFNEGIIIATGDSAMGVELERSYVQTFFNSSLIHGSGTGAIGLQVGNDVAIGDSRIDNSGTISASGTDSVAVRLGGNANLHNTGTIRSENTAVELRYPNFQALYQSGGLIEAPVAVSGIDTSLKGLFVSGGEIHGDLEHLLFIQASGASTLDSSRMDASHMTIHDGRLTLTRPHGTLAGYLEFESTGELELMLNSSTVASRPFLNIEGGAYVDRGAKVIVTPTPNDFALDGQQRYQLIRAAGWYQLDAAVRDYVDLPLPLDTLTVTSTSGLLQVNSYSLDNGVLSAEIEPLQGNAAADLVASAGASHNAQNAMQAFSQQLGRLDANDPVFRALASSDAAHTARIAEQLSPEANGASPLGVLDAVRRFEGALLDRADSSQHREGASPWVRAIGSTLKSGTRQGVRGFDLDNRGVAIGVDWGIGSSAVAGLAYGHYRGDTSHSNGNKLESQGHLLGLYGHYQWGGFYIAGDLTYGWIEDEHRRYIAGTRAKGDGDGREFGSSLMMGYRFPLQDGLTLEPRVAARYAEVRLDSYSEKGSSAALRVNSRRYQSGELGAGLKLSGQYPLGTGTLFPEATLMGWYDNVGDRTNVTSNFLNGEPSFATRGVVPSRNSYESSLGLRYRIGNLSVGAGYSYAMRNDANARSAQASVSLSF